ncbi:ImmA/IrrE family metallo-endopeptidase [Lysinibacillus telephonicus]|uniref:ImmA/IrrE family metallo-endopeptidase n=1 Tax=Lysinibacillus telephonicus TaxID=1714840 RepID=A0A431UF73_9BACI|nr:ImmA/IrrE family metallo-endopeptidase [Lysinibacillus telephonicus]
MNQEFYHELGHVVLHIGNQRQMTDSFRRYKESKANHFMYHACVPTFMI